MNTMPRKKLHIALIMGGPSAEHEVSLSTGKVILKNLDKKKYRITPITITKSGVWKFEHKKGVSIGRALDILVQKNIDSAFIALHGTFGEDGTIQGFFEVARIPYTGSGVLASALAMNKARSYEVFTSVGLYVPKHQVIEKKEWRKEIKKIKVPCVIKPVQLGSSVGISIVKKTSELFTACKYAFNYTDSVLVDEYISGSEVTCGVLDDGRGGNIRALPPTEIIPQGGTFFDYTAKYIKGGSEEITPARFSKVVIVEIQKMAVQAHTALGCSGMSRSDFIIRRHITRNKQYETKIYILETNTIPGMTETSLLPQAAQVAGISFPKLLDLIIKAGTRRENN